MDTIHNTDYIEDDVVLVEYGFNEVREKPYIFLYEFGYYSATEGKCIVYKQGERNIQDSYCFDLDKIRYATDKDKRDYLWGH